MNLEETKAATETETETAEVDRNTGYLIIINIHTGNNALTHSLINMGNNTLMDSLINMGNQLPVLLDNALIHSRVHLHHNWELARKDPCPILFNRVILWKIFPVVLAFRPARLPPSILLLILVYRCKLGNLFAYRLGMNSIIWT
jgi:hypothetical protein